MAFTLDQVVPWGRSLSEYQRMFSLSAEDQHRLILGAGDGPASFNAELAGEGGRGGSVHPLYAFSSAEISQRIDQTYDKIVDQLWPLLGSYVWHEFADPAALGRHRMATMQKFLADYERGRRDGRYVVGALPMLDFADHQFDLALCSHLLFLYSEQLSYDFHLAAVKELCRVARQVRIFPLLNLAVQPSPHVAPLYTKLVAEGYQVEILPVTYEFQRGGNQMMVVARL